ncbi:MAG: amino acid permease [Candidatus Coatesbacteria bacterium]|nr:amino acid permease [Candidatus Coatesbacteria bacterium]
MEFKKQLGALDVFSIAIGAMISSGIFILPGLAFAKTGPSVVLSYFMAGILAMTSMVSTAELITAMPKTGGDFFFVSRSLGPALGMTSSLLSWYSTILKTSFTLIGISHFLLLVIDVNIHMTSVILCIVFIVINITGVKTVSRIQLTLVTIVILITLFYILTGIPKVKMGNFVHFAPFGLKGIIGTAGLITYLLLADKSIKREYALQYLIDRIRKLPAERTMLENELKEILTKNAGK